jgi:hypothetical protein
MHPASAAGAGGTQIACAHSSQVLRFTFAKISGLEHERKKGAKGARYSLPDDDALLALGTVAHREYFGARNALVIARGGV